MEIVLLGYMGSGKSTIGKYLSKKMNLEFIDLDEYIEEKEKMTIKNLFSEKGEIYFRLQESKYLKEILNNRANYILSLGGGTPCYANNIQEIKNSSTESFYLKCNINTLHSRLKNSNSTRPLIASLNDEDLFEYIGKHLFERAPYYEQAKFKVSLDDKNVEETYCDIIAQLH